MEVHNYDSISDRLLPCPFCGSAPTWHLKGNEFTRSQKIVIKCPKCRIQRSDAMANELVKRMVRKDGSQRISFYREEYAENPRDMTDEPLYQGEEITMLLMPMLVND